MVVLKSVKFGSNPDSRSAGTWVLQMVALKSLKFCLESLVACPRSAGTSVLQMVALKSVKFHCHTGSRSAGTSVLQMVALKSLKSGWLPGTRTAGTWVLQIVALKSVKFRSNSNPRTAQTWVLQTFRLKSVKFCCPASLKSEGNWVLESCALGVSRVCSRWGPQFSSVSCKKQFFRQKSQRVPLDNEDASFVGLSAKKKCFELWQRPQELFRQLRQVVLAQRQQAQAFQAKESVFVQRSEVGTAQIHDLHGYAGNTMHRQMKRIYF